jgi:hypothetical protein
MLALHEKSKNHLVAILKRTEVQKQPFAVQTIDNVQQSLNQEKICLHKIFKSSYSVVQFLVERNIAFRGAIGDLSEARNGIFLCILQFLLGKFDPVMQDHMQRIATKQIHESNISKTIQNEIINLVGNESRYLCSILRTAIGTTEAYQVK